jgi:hypothetical protein
MNLEIKRKWVAALRGGRYPQGHNTLRQKGPNGDQFCCLGVLCDVVDPSGWEGYSHHGSRNIPRREILELFGGEIKEQPIWDRLVELNDNLRLSFTEIANFIETHVEET